MKFESSARRMDNIIVKLTCDVSERSVVEEYADESGAYIINSFPSDILVMSLEQGTAAIEVFGTRSVWLEEDPFDDPKSQYKAIGKLLEQEQDVEFETFEIAFEDDTVDVNVNIRETYPMEPAGTITVGGTLK